jgi:micrococcal nuclease
MAVDYSELRMTKAAPVAEIVSPLQIKLGGGSIVHLVGLDIPGYTPYESGAYAPEIISFLQERLKGRQVRLYQTKNAKKGRRNRLGHELAHVEEKGDGLWLQGEIIKRGLARVRPSSDNTEMAAQMLALESQARAANLGLWQDETYRVLPPAQAGQAMNNWAIIEGTVRAAAMVKNTIYLNFGENWREDFTIAITPTVRRALAKNGVDPLSLGNKAVRVRGWIESYNGPYLELMHPVWLEILTN